MKKFDFSGWATRNNLKCSDGRTILKDAFKDNDGQTVPLVWNHQHNGPFNVLGHALLENRADGVYAYCTFNDTEQGRNAKLLVEHGDVSALSIFANQLRERASNVLHGAIRISTEKGWMTNRSKSSRQADSFLSTTYSAKMIHCFPVSLSSIRE